MSLLKLPSMVSFSQDKTLQEKRFIQNQSELNNFIKKNHKMGNYYNEAQEVTGLSTTANLPDLSRVKFNQSGVDSKIQGKMLEDQMRLKSLETQFDHEKQKIEDQHNAKTFRKKYPYGKENVRITEDVIEKYRTNNYLDQSQMLRKFQQDAKRRKQQQMSRRRGGQLNYSRSVDQSQLQLNNYYHRSLRKKTSILQRQVNKLYDSKNQQNKRKMKRKFRSCEKQNQNLDKIQNMLNQVKLKLHLNIANLSIRQKQRIKQMNSMKQEQMTRERLQKLSELAKQQDFYRRKVPVVVYNDEKDNEKNYFPRVVCADIENYERKDKIFKPQQFSEVINIYNLNKKRMDHLSEKSGIMKNKSTI